MAWTEQTGIADTWETDTGDTTWDSGATLWDVSGNVEGTEWDISLTSYTEQTGATPTWAAV